MDFTKNAFIQKSLVNLTKKIYQLVNYLTLICLNLTKNIFLLFIDFAESKL